MTTAREHLDWCVERAMEYADTGDMPNAWASFAYDAKEHPGTAHIPGDTLFAVAMFSGLYRSKEQFRRFISGWNVS